MKIIDLNSRVHDACVNAMRRMEAADLARPAGLTSAASLAYRLLFNGLMSEHGYGPDDPVEWATRSTRAVITIQELATEYRMLAETSEEYDTRKVLQDVAVALNTLANEIQDSQVEPKLEPGVLKCARHSTMIDWDDDIKELYEASVKQLQKVADIVTEKLGEKYVEVFSTLLWKACACQEFINTITRDKKLQLIEAAVIVRGLVAQINDMWFDTYTPEKEEILEDAQDVLCEFERTILATMPSDDTEQ